ALRGLLAADNTGGTARSLAVQGELFGRTVQFEHAAFSDFISDANTPQRRRTRDTTLRMGGGLRLGARPCTYDLRLQATTFADRDIERQDGAVLRLATGWSRATWTGKLDYRRSGAQGDDDRRLLQEHLLSSWWGPLLLRGQLRSGITPDFGLESAGGSAGWQAARFLRLGAHVERDLQDLGTTGYGGSLTLLLDGVQVALSGHGASGQETFFSVGVSTSLTKVPETMRLHVQRTRLTGGYGATARVFLDRNANGLYDDRDEPLPDVRFAGGGAMRHATTDRLGLAYLPDLPAYDTRDVTLDVESLQDPYLIPALQAVRAVGHPGAHLALEFPVTYSGDIEGTIFVQTPAGRTPLRNVGLELLDLKRRTIKTTVSEFDGYYLFQGIPPGWYEVHVIESSLARRNLRATPPLAAAVPVDGGVVAGNDFVLKFATSATVNR
ncbi:MAG: carboxypeptidase-like regulatory domain-containing protein, partial [Candidatus Latescibacteria bacterium]|nr:carboxypeptidase-like regulatory domain-containing protein [Candidatus Latescibacterota bacterium]